MAVTKEPRRQEGTVSLPLTKVISAKKKKENEGKISARI
jgi:hypothetical protein